MDEKQEKQEKPTLNIASDSLHKGEVRKGKELIAWDCIQTCDSEICPLALRDNCQFMKHGEKCSVQVAYLQNLTDMLFSMYRYMDEEKLFMVGMHVVPLYSMLCRQKIVEKSVTSITYEDAKGKILIHPIYKEIRETMKTLSMIWKDIGFGIVLDPGSPVVGATATIGKPGFGNPNHYADISKNDDDKRGIIR